MFVCRLTVGLEISCPLAAPPCPLALGFNEMSIKFVEFSNPFNMDYNDQPCDAPGADPADALCDLVMSVCVSKPDSR